MRDILDIANLWVGSLGGAFAFDNKSPVALDDTLSVLRDAGPVIISVLANDIDPEGGTLTLLSASAALGTAVAEANNTVTYTPPPGLTGFDTVVYEIADPLDQRTTGQVNITITAPPVTVSTTPENTLTVTAGIGALDLTITQPAPFAGTYVIQTNDLSSGPINLVVPHITGMAVDGQTLTATSGLWANDIEAGLPVQTWQWTRDGQPISAATNTTYLVSAADENHVISVSETLSNMFGARSAASPPAQSFLPNADAALRGWWDAADTSTISASGNRVFAWADKSGGAALAQNSTLNQPLTGTRNINGLNTLDFTGTHFLERLESMPVSGDFAVHMVLSVDQVDNAFAAVLAIDSAANDFQIDAGSDTQFNGRLYTTGIGLLETPFSGGPFVGAILMSAIFDQSGSATAEIYIANTLRATMAYSTAVDTNAALHVMTNRARNTWVDGAVAELVVSGDVTNRAQYHAYLTNKWGLS